MITVDLVFIRRMFMKTKKKRTLRSQLFFNFSLLFFIIIFLIFLTINLYFTNRITKQQINSQVQLCSSFEETIKNKVNTIDTLSKNITYSSLVHKAFEEHIKLSSSKYLSKENKGSLYSNATNCANILSNVIGLTPSITQVNLYDVEGGIIGYGLYNGLIRRTSEDVPWIAHTKDLNGKKHLSIPHQMEWINNSKSTNYISLTRTYKDSDYKIFGYIEVIQDYSYFFEFLNQSHKNYSSSEVYVFNQFMECIYPIDLSYSHVNEVQDMLKNKKLLDNSTAKSIFNEVPYLITLNKSSGSSFSVVVMQPYAVVHKALGSFYIYFIPIFILCLLVITFLCLMIANRITEPLKNLKSAIKQVNLSELAISGNMELLTTNSDFYEISKVVDAFNAMNDKLGQTVNDLLFAQNEKINYKILAIQSQMNPHFLHNNLTNLSIMAEENMNTQIQQTCTDLSSMLRYISSQNQPCVELVQELDYIEKYMNCIKIRYEEDIKLTIDIPQNMLCIPIPKLSIQPLVENSVQYALTNTPPWVIHISGRVENDAWIISVQDNGLGFNEETLNIINSNINIFNTTSQLPDLKIGGMGLLNIYVRLRLLYRNNAIFKIENSVQGGACITIGGKYNRGDRENEI